MTRKFTFMVTVEAESESAAYDMIYDGVRNFDVTDSFDPQGGSDYDGTLLISNLTRQLAKCTKPSHLALLKQRVAERNT